MLQLPGNLHWDVATLRLADPDDEPCTPLIEVPYNATKYLLSVDAGSEWQESHDRALMAPEIAERTIGAVDLSKLDTRFWGWNGSEMTCASSQVVA